MNPILVTGASGFVGRRLVAALESGGVVVRPHTSNHGHIAQCSFEPGAALAIHLAGRSFVPESWKRPLEFYETNVLGTVNVLEYCRQNHCPLIYVSSYVYGYPKSLPIAEDHPLEALSPYAQTKVMAEDVCRFYASHHGVPLAIVRPFNLYGPGQPEHFLIPLLVKQAVSPETLEFSIADERPRRDFIHVDDLVSLLLRIADPFTPGTFNAGSGVSHSISDVVALLNSITGRPKPVRDRGERRPNEILDVVADIRKAARELNWRPAVELTEGLRRLIPFPEYLSPLRHPLTR